MNRCAAIALLAALALLAAPASAQDTADVPDLSVLAGVIRWTGLFVSLLIIAGAAVLLRFIEGAAEQLSLRFANRRLTIQKFESFTRFFVYFATAAIVVTLSFRIDKTVLTIVGGALAFAVGFAMRDLVAAVIAGVMIMFDRPFQVGDRVNYAGQYGDIIQIGVRSVRMRTLDDVIVTIPNNKVLTDVTASGNYGVLHMLAVIDFYIGVDQDVELAERLVREALLSSRYVYLGKPVEVLVKIFLNGNYPVIRLRGRACMLDTKYELLFDDDVNRRVIRAFRRHGLVGPAQIHRLDAKQLGSVTTALERARDVGSD